MFQKQGKYYGSYCMECRRLDSERRRREKGVVKDGQGRREKKPPVILTKEERRIKHIEYGYIPKGSWIATCVQCNRKFAKEVIVNGICAVCGRNKRVIKKTGRPKKYKNQIERKKKQQNIEEEL